MCRIQESNGTFTMAEGKKDCIQFIGAPLRGEVIDAINILQQKVCVNSLGMLTDAHVDLSQGLADLRLLGY